MKTEEGNKLIAEFMGAILKPYPRDQLPSYYYDQSVCKTPTPSSSLWWGEWELQYHSSWDWLMPVVEKIEDLGNIFTISQTYCNIQEDKHNVSVTGVKYGKTKMEAVYQAVIQFIMWYNQQGTKINR